jgi:hypothetical protein
MNILLFFWIKLLFILLKQGCWRDEGLFLPFLINDSYLLLFDEYRCYLFQEAVNEKKDW